MYVKAQLLLGASIVAAIAFVGCIFELASGEPQWGPAATWGTLAISLPLAVGGFVFAVRLARASMEQK